MARYRILIADPLLGMGLVWPDGCSLVQPMEPGPAGSHWHLLDDPQAPRELDGRHVELTLSRVDGAPVITGRRLIVTHLADPRDDMLLCCETALHDLHHSDRLTCDPQAATCEGSRAPGEVAA